MKILLYGFAPFGHNATNISQQVVEQYPQNPDLIKHVFPTRFNSTQFLAVAEQYQPNLIIGLGQYPRGKKIRIETIAYNSYHSKSHPTPRVILPRAPATLPLCYLPPATLNSYLSNNPGRYVCNYSMYLFADWALSHNAKSCFLHLPKSCNPDTISHNLTAVVMNFVIKSSTC